jgi:hypothetical protein
MFERICRENGITARNTKPRTPTTTGKVERFHQTLQRELLDHVEVWPDLETAQAAVDAFRAEYYTNRPHQSLDMAFPADGFVPRPADERLPLRLPNTLTPAAPAPRPAPPTVASTELALLSPPVVSSNGGEPVTLAVEVSRTVPGSGNLTVAGRQFWLGPDRAGQLVTLWADTTVVHLLVNSVRLKTVPSRLSVAQLRQLLADGGRPAGRRPLPTGDAGPAAAIEVDRLVATNGLIGWAAAATRSAASSPAAASPSGWIGACCNWSTRACCCTAWPTRSPRQSRPGCATPARPVRHPRRRPSRCVCSDACRAAALWSSPSNASTSASSTPDGR